MKCHLEGASPLRLTLTGMCTGVPAFKEVQHFSSHVRNKEAKNLMVINRTNQLWQLKPIIDGEYWTGPDWFVVEPQQSKPYELTYFPLTMTHENRKHQVNMGLCSCVENKSMTLGISFCFNPFRNVNDDTCTV